MLETYFVKSQTVGRIRAGWIGAEIERYAGWLAEQGYSTRTVLRRIPAALAFGEFARRRGASVPADLPAHVDDFVAMRELITARDWLTVYQLPPYASELNPVEMGLP